MSSDKRLKILAVIEDNNEPISEEKDNFITIKLNEDCSISMEDVDDIGRAVGKFIANTLERVRTRIDE